MLAAAGATVVGTGRTEALGAALHDGLEPRFHYYRVDTARPDECATFAASVLADLARRTSSSTTPP